MWPNSLPSAVQSAPVTRSESRSIASRLRSSVTSALAWVRNRPPADAPPPSRPNRSLPPLPVPEPPAPRISAASTFPSDVRTALAEKFHIRIAPLRLGGVELGHLLSSRRTDCGCILLCARVEHPHDTFEKPHDVALAFAAPWGEIPDKDPVEFAHLLRNHQVDIPDTQVCGFGPSGEVPDYPLFGIPLHLGHAAQFVGAMASAPGDNDFDVVVLNRHAEGMTLSDLLRAIRQEMRGAPAALVCHFVRDPRPGPRGVLREGRAATLSAR